MICSICGGPVSWRGPLSALTHTQCHSCGRTNCQIVEVEYPEDDEPAPEDETR